jgi:hypothetical protein
MKFASLLVSLLFLVLWSPLVKSLRREADSSNEKPSFRAFSFLAERKRKPKTIAEVTKTFPAFWNTPAKVIPDFKREKKIRIPESRRFLKQVANLESVKFFFE